MSKGDSKMQQAMGELRDADNKYFEFDSKDAIKSFNKALGHIDDAIVNYAKAHSTPAQIGMKWPRIRERNEAI